MRRGENRKSVIAGPLRLGLLAGPQKYRPQRNGSQTAPAKPCLDRPQYALFPLDGKFRAESRDSGRWRSGHAGFWGSLRRGIRSHALGRRRSAGNHRAVAARDPLGGGARSEEHTSELQSLMRISYAVFCLKNKKKKDKQLYDIQ